MSIISNDRKIFELITKLIYDTINNRIQWHGENSGSGGEYHADYDDLYHLVFRMVFSKVKSYRLILSDKNGTIFPEIVDINSLSDLYDSILDQTGYGDKMDNAIEHILHF